MIRTHLVGIHVGPGWFQAICEDCPWKGTREATEAAAEAARESHHVEVGPPAPALQGADRPRLDRGAAVIRREEVLSAEEARQNIIDAGGF